MENLVSHKNLEFSIVVCTYNPRVDLLDRLLHAIQAIVSTNEFVEVLLVDNYSSPAIGDLDIVKVFLSQVPSARCIIELNRGLAAARYRAIQETSAPIVVFFDDDNEPNSDYLKVLDRYFSDYPNVGIWGPGEITVEYVDPVKPWFRQHTDLFQQRNLPFSYSCVPAIFDVCMPNGTGFAVRRKILHKYITEVSLGKLKATGRTGKNFASAEDVQIVWEGVKLGFAAGMIEELKCNHLIDRNKANMGYLKRLHFGTASSYATALLESYPESINQLGSSPTILRVYKTLFEFILKILSYPQKYSEIQLQIATTIGNFYGHSLALGAPSAEKILAISKYLGLT